MKLTKEQTLEILLNAHSISDDEQVWLVDDTLLQEDPDCVNFVGGPEYRYSMPMNINCFSVTGDGNLCYSPEGDNGEYTLFQVLGRLDVRTLLK